MRAGAIIVAGGMGKRMNAGTPKQLIELSGRTILEWTFEPFIACPEVAELVVVSEPGILARLEELVEPFRASGKPIAVVPGGRERQDSVACGLAVLSRECGIAAIHDAVRPFVTAGQIAACIHAGGKFGAATLMVPVRDTVKRVRDGIVEATIDRADLWVTQTPQAFRREIIEQAHEQAARDRFIGSDDCVLVERLGIEVHAVEGSGYNIKITTPDDLAIAEALLAVLKKGGRHAGHRPRI